MGQCLRDLRGMTVRMERWRDWLCLQLQLAETEQCWVPVIARKTVRTCLLAPFIATVTCAPGHPDRRNCPAWTHDAYTYRHKFVGIEQEEQLPNPGSTEFSGNSKMSFFWGQQKAWDCGTVVLALTMTCRQVLRDLCSCKQEAGDLGNIAAICSS